MKHIEHWEDFFKDVKTSLYFANIEKLIAAQSEKRIFPPSHLIFNAFTLTPLSSVKVVIIGQDPYHQEGQAMGLAFSVPEGTKLPPSLRNIFKEMQNDLGGMVNVDGDLTYLAKQGVFLFNTTLTVEEGKPLSHQNSAYTSFAIDVLKCLSNQNRPIVFILWGRHARSLRKYIGGIDKYVIEGNHPSPLSANQGGFFGTKPFSQTNEFLIKHGLTPIKWLK